jgi:hypothetical protein
MANRCPKNENMGERFCIAGAKIGPEDHVFPDEMREFCAPGAGNRFFVQKSLSFAPPAR